MRMGTRTGLGSRVYRLGVWEHPATRPRTFKCLPPVLGTIVNIKDEEVLTMRGKQFYARGLPKMWGPKDYSAGRYMRVSPIAWKYPHLTHTMYT